MPSFTTQVPNLQGVGPVVEVRLAVGAIIEEVLRQNNQAIPTPLPVLSMIDTGATGTVIQESLINLIADFTFKPLHGALDFLVPVFAHFGHQIGKVVNDIVNYFQLLRET